MHGADSLARTGIFDALEMGVVVLDGQRRVLEWNAWMASATGTAPEEALGKRLEEIFETALNARLASAINDALGAGTSSFLTNSLHAAILPLRTKAGRELVHNVTVRPAPGVMSGCLIQVFDVTVAVERDRMLRKRQNARYDAVVDSAPDAILTLDARGVIQFVNPAAAAEFGYKPAELVDRPVATLFEDQPAWREAWTVLQAEAPLPHPVELTARRRNGSFSYVDMSASAWRSDTRIFVTVILRNANERRKAEAALRELNRALEHRVEERTADRDRMWRLSSDVMLVLHQDGTITACNPAWQSLIGHDAGPGQNLGDAVLEEDRPALHAALERVAGAAAPLRFELRFRDNEGKTRWISWSAVLAEDLWQAVGRDVTAEREAEEALSKAEEALRQSQKMEAIGQLTGGIAHDFNNLLTGIIGSMDMIKRHIAAGRLGDVERFINAAVVSADRAAALTHRLLAFARRQPLDPQVIDVSRLIDEMAELLHRTLGEQIQLKIVREGVIGAIRTDANQLENAVLNLAINARDAMPHGGTLKITISNIEVKHAPGDAEPMAPGSYTRISVADTGTGMSAGTAAKAFDPFFTTKPIGQGTGLGLSMIYGFVTQSRGYVRIESAEGRGTTVLLYLPQCSAAEPELEDEAPQHPLPQGAGETVLLVEDEPSVRMLIGEVLSELGYTCVDVADGAAALPILASTRRIDLMITDVGLPGMNGRQLAEIARQHRPGLKILFVTGYAEHATIRSGFLEPGMEMVTKPFALDLLANKINQMFADA
jgi:PAS domain S-box-containing protein